MNFHKSFQLNGETFANPNEIIDFSKEISSEIHLFLKDWFSEKRILEVKTSGSTGLPKTVNMRTSPTKRSMRQTRWCQRSRCKSRTKQQRTAQGTNQGGGCPTVQSSSRLNRGNMCLHDQAWQSVCLCQD